MIRRIHLFVFIVSLVLPLVGFAQVSGTLDIGNIQTYDKKITVSIGPIPTSSTTTKISYSFAEKSGGALLNTGNAVIVSVQSYFNADLGSYRYWFDANTSTLTNGKEYTLTAIGLDSKGKKSMNSDSATFVALNSSNAPEFLAVNTSDQRVTLFAKNLVTGTTRVYFGIYDKDTGQIVSGTSKNLSSGDPDFIGSTATADYTNLTSLVDKKDYYGKITSDKNTTGYTVAFKAINSKYIDPETQTTTTSDPLEDDDSLEDDTATRASQVDLPYVFLSQIPIIGSSFDSTQPNAFQNLLNNFLKLFYWLIGVAAVLFIIIEGISFMNANGPFAKSSARKRIQQIIWGIILAFIAVWLLNIINTRFTNLSIGAKKITITVSEDEKNFAKVEQPISKFDYYILQGTYDNPKPSNPDVNNCVKYLKAGEKFTKFMVYKNKTARIFTTDSKGKETYCADIKINIGQLGFGEVAKNPPETDGSAMKTPRGTFTLNPSKFFKSKNDHDPAKTFDKKYNLGAAYIGLNMTHKGKDRGILIHGDAKNCVVNCYPYSYSQGCIKMSNDDLLLLIDYFKRDNPTVVIE